MGHKLKTNTNYNRFLNKNRETEKLKETQNHFTKTLLLGKNNKGDD